MLGGPQPGWPPSLGRRRARDDPHDFGDRTPARPGEGHRPAIGRRPVVLCSGLM